jgi:aspartate racemase
VCTGIHRHSYKNGPAFMKTIGMLGGMSWESTAVYYRAINEGIKAKLGSLHSAEIILKSLDFEKIEQLQHAGDWEATAAILKKAAKSVEVAGADFLIICTNTMHIVAPEITNHIKIPILHIADATGERLIKDKISSVGLLGTNFTMEKPFYKDHLRKKYGIEVVIPPSEERERLHEIIYDELCCGIVKKSSKEFYLEVIDKLTTAGVEGIILGCTEIGMLVSFEDTEIRLYDTTEIHADQAVNFALKGKLKTS